MSKLFSYSNFYLVGIKGVAMSAMAQLLLDADKTVSGCDVAEDFVTQPNLEKNTISIDVGFEHELPEATDCVIYTSAHDGKYNPMVVQAREKNIPTYSHAEALGLFTQNKKTIAVCGVGGKSTVSAMLAWIFEKNNIPISYSVGVGAIPGLRAAAKYNKEAEYFIVEADEYVTDPAAKKNNEPITPRFSFLHPYITVATNISFDHPDVYEDFEDTKTHFENFFQQISPEGSLVINLNSTKLELQSTAQTQITFGKDESADIFYTFNPKDQKPGKTIANIIESSTERSETSHQLQLAIPGEYNVQNALAAIAAAQQAGIHIQESIHALNSFASTQRRFEKKKTIGEIIFYDDYAHHPNEIVAAIKALNNWYPNSKKIIAFQPHTYSRTKQLLHEFSHAFKDASEVLLLDIFASARESADPSISSENIVQNVNSLYPNIQIENIHSLEGLRRKLAELDTSQPTVVLTLGAGDIYKVHDMI